MRLRIIWKKDFFQTAVTQSYYTEKKSVDAINILPLTFVNSN